VTEAHKFVVRRIKFGGVVDYASLIKIILHNFALKSIKLGENASVRFNIFAIRCKGNLANFATVKKKELSTITF
jgi:hypothetical protein